MKKYNLIALFFLVSLVLFSYLPWDMINDLADEETPEFIIENNPSDVVFDQSLKTDLYEDGVASFLSGTDTLISVEPLIQIFGIYLPPYK